MLSNTVLFPLRLLIYFVRLLAAVVNVLVYFLFAVLLYLVAIPLFLLNALLQGVLYPVRLIRGETATTNFRVASLLRGPYDLFIRKEEQLVDWVRDSWRVFETGGSKRQRLQAEKDRLMQQTVVDESREHSYSHQPPPVHQRKEPTLPGFAEDEALSIPVLGGKDQLWRGKASNVWHYVRLHCPHCGELEQQSRRGYPVQNEGASVLQFTQDPGSEYTGGEGYGVWTCDACGETSYMFESSPSRGAYNYWTRQWERRPRLRYKPAAEISPEQIESAG